MGTYQPAFGPTQQVPVSHVTKQVTLDNDPKWQEDPLSQYLFGFCLFGQALKTEDNLNSCSSLLL